MKRQGLQQGIYILPNLITTVNLFFGFMAMVKSINGEFIHAAWFILWAGVFDFLDGGTARLTKTQSKFGVEYDSLVDSASFGLAPAILMYTWALAPYKKLGWFAAFMFFACGALRLARFNVKSAIADKRKFQGLPIPAAAYTMSSFVIFHHYYFGPTPTQGYWIIAMTMLLALLMVSNVSYRSFKGIDLNRPATLFLLVLFVGVIFLIATEPETMIFGLAILYISSGLIPALYRSPQYFANLSQNISKLFIFEQQRFRDARGRKNKFNNVVDIETAKSDQSDQKNAQ